MKDLKNMPLELFMLAGARRDGRLGFGRLRIPQTPPLATGVDVQAVKTAGWCLEGTLHPALYDAIAQNGLQGQEGRIVTLPNGHRFLVLSQQAGVWQHRFVWALEGTVVRQCLADCLTRPLHMAFKTAGRTEALTGMCAWTIPEITDLPGDDVDTSDHLYEQAALVMHMLWAQVVCIEAMPLAEHVCVSVVQTSGNHPELQTDLQLHGLLSSLDR